MYLKPVFIYLFIISSDLHVLELQIKSIKWTHAKTSKKILFNIGENTHVKY